MQLVERERLEADQDLSIMVSSGWRVVWLKTSAARPRPPRVRRAERATDGAAPRRQAGLRDEARLVVGVDGFCVAGAHHRDGFRGTGLEPLVMAHRAAVEDEGRERAHGDGRRAHETALLDTVNAEGFIVQTSTDRKPATDAMAA